MGFSVKPRAFDAEFLWQIAEDGEMFARVDLDFQSKWCNRSDFRIKAVDKCGSTFRLFTLWLAEPRVKDVVQCRKDRTDSFRLKLNQIYVFGVASGRVEKEFVEGGSAAKRKAVGEFVVGKDFD